MRVTRIAKQERRDRYNVFVDGKFFTALSAELLAEAGIAEDDELSLGQLDPFIDRDAVGKVCNQALRFLSLRPHSEHELRVKLTRKDIAPELIEEAFERLRQLEYLDDLAFATQWAEERGRQRGTVLLRAELRRKKVADEVIAAVLDRPDRDELSDAQALVAKRLARLTGQPPAIIRQRLTRYLVSRGYGYDVARQAIESPDAPTKN